MTSAGFKYSNYGKSALGWNGNAADPRPDYYKKLPSSIFDVWESVPTADELQQFNEVTDNWKNNKLIASWIGMLFILPINKRMH